MKKTLKFLCFALITSMCVIISSCEKNPTIDPDLNTWVDLGLPSGTLWRKYNEIGYYTYNEAISQFENALPTKEQFKELKKECKWKWKTNRYKITGPNGNSITLPAAGYRDVSDEVCLVDSRGSYWSSTPYGSRYACSLGFNSYNIYMFYGNRDCERSVHLIKNPN